MRYSNHFYRSYFANRATMETSYSRCKRAFPSPRALQQHYDDSASHHRCEICGFDENTWGKLLIHHRETKHRDVCQGCDDGEGMTWVAGSQEYLDHLKEQNVCQICEMHFQSDSNLDHVSPSFQVGANTGFSIKWCIWNDQSNATAATGNSPPIVQ